jgi:hypothetical protein
LPKAADFWEKINLDRRGEENSFVIEVKVVQLTHTIDIESLLLPTNR